MSGFRTNFGYFALVLAVLSGLFALWHFWLHELNVAEPWGLLCLWQVIAAGYALDEKP